MSVGSSDLPALRHILEKYSLIPSDARDYARVSEAQQLNLSPISGFVKSVSMFNLNDKVKAMKHGGNIRQDSAASLPCGDNDLYYATNRRKMPDERSDEYVESPRAVRSNGGTFVENPLQRTRPIDSLVDLLTRVKQVHSDKVPISLLNDLRAKIDAVTCQFTKKREDVEEARAMAHAENTNSIDKIRSENGLPKSAVKTCNQSIERSKAAGSSTPKRSDVISGDHIASNVSRACSSIVGTRKSQIPIPGTKPAVVSEEVMPKCENNNVKNIYQNSDTSRKSASTAVEENKTKNLDTPRVASTSAHARRNPLHVVQEADCFSAIEKLSSIPDESCEEELTVETILPDLIKYQLQAKFLEFGIDRNHERFAHLSQWAYFQVAYEVNTCISEGAPISYCCLKRIIPMAARIAVTLFRV